jgi:hypothetical protein
MKKQTPVSTGSITWSRTGSGQGCLISRDRDAGEERRELERCGAKVLVNVNGGEAVLDLTDLTTYFDEFTLTAINKRTSDGRYVARFEGTCGAGDDDELACWHKDFGLSRRKIQAAKETWMGDRRRVLERFVNDADRKLIEVDSAIVNGEDILDATPMAHSVAEQRLGEASSKLKAINVPWFLTIEEEVATTESERRRLQRLKQSYEKASYGKLVHSEKGRIALSLLNEWHFSLAAVSGKIPREFVSKIYGPKTLLEFLDPILTALTADDEEFFHFLTEAVALRRSRIREPDLRTRLHEYAILQGKKAVLTSYELRTKFEPGGRGDIKNFQKILDECGVAWVRIPRGGPGKPRERRKRGTA